MNKTCEHCQFWKRWQLPYREDVGTCKNPAFIYIGEGEENPDRKNQTPTNGVGFLDTEGYSASLEMGKDFGCIHFSERKN